MRIKIIRAIAAKINSCGEKELEERLKDIEEASIRRKLTVAEIAEYNFICLKVISLKK